MRLLKVFSIITQMMSCLTSTIGAGGKKERESARYPGDFIIGSLFSIHEPPSASQRNCVVIREMYGIQRMEITFLTLDRINRDPTILPNITLGAEVRDSCWYAPVALQQTLDLVRNSRMPHEKSTCTGGNKLGSDSSSKPKGILVGVLGPGSSHVAMQVQNLLQLFEIPQVSFSATSRDLSDKSRYETFLRVVPSDYYQARLLVDLILYHNWNYVSAIYTDENYGQSGMAAFRELAGELGVCIAREDRFLSTATFKDFDAVIEKIRPKTSIENPHPRVVVCYCEGETVTGLLAAIKRKGIAGDLLIIGSDGWADRRDVVAGYEEEAEGSISIRIRSPTVKYFPQYYFKLKPNTNKRNPWFKQFWEQKFSCRLPGKRKKSLYNNNYYSRNCQAHSLSEGYNQDPKLNFIIRALYAMAYALHNMQRSLCGNRNGVCEKMICFNSSLYQRFILNVSVAPPGDDIVDFDSNGDVPERSVRYEIMNFQRVNNTWVYRLVGEWRGGNLTLNTELYYSGAGRSVVKDHRKVLSICSKPCSQGYHKVTDDPKKRCCWSCIPCGDNEIQVSETACEPCELGSSPNNNKTHCLVNEMEYLKWTDTEAIVAISFACFGLIVTGFTTVVFFKYNQTPVVKSTTRELSYLILIGMTISHGSVFIIIAKPTDLTCFISNFLPGISFAMIYASILTKTHRIARIMAVSKKNITTCRPRFMSGIAQVVISVTLTITAGCCFIIATQYWGLNAQTTYPKPTRSLLTCNVPTQVLFAELFPAIAYLAGSVVLAIKTRHLPNNYNEAMFIGVATYTTCVIWIAFFPIYFGSESKSITLCICVTLTATITLIFLFCPRLYIILLYPERNTRAHFITSRSIRCHIGGEGNKTTGRSNNKRPCKKCKKISVRTVSCQTLTQEICQLDQLNQRFNNEQWAKIDVNPLLEENNLIMEQNFQQTSSGVKCECQERCLRQTRIREESVSDFSIIDDDSQTQIKSITITLGNFKKT